MMILPPEGLPFFKATKPYADTDELIGECKSFLDVLAYRYSETIESAYYECGGEDSAVRGDYLLSQDAKEELDFITRYFDSRLALSGSDLPLIRVFESLSMDTFKRSCVMLAVAAMSDERFERLFAWLQKDQTACAPSVALICRMCAYSGESIPECRAQFEESSAFSYIFDASSLKIGEVRLSLEIWNYIYGINIDGDFSFSPPVKEELPVRRELIEKTAERLYRIEDTCAVTLLCGHIGSGRSFIAKNACALLNMGVLCCDISINTRDRIFRAALLSKLYVCGLLFYDLDHLAGEQEQAAVAKAIKSSGIKHAFMICSENTRFFSASADVTVFKEEIGIPTAEERLRLFMYFSNNQLFDDDISLSEIAGKFSFYPAQIKNALKQSYVEAKLSSKGSIDAELLHICCYKQVTHKLGEMAARVDTRYSWDDLVLPSHEKMLMQQACKHIQFKHRVFCEWGFDKKISYGKGLSMMFSGPPGTGKTMGAQVIAKELHMELFQIQISQVMSKYIGETEKNLREIFKEAKSSSSILFFDECDALFGKRSEVKDSNDRYANAETAYLLQQIEEHDGVTILATNLMQNIDSAFMRRIRFVIHFPFPDAPARCLLFKKMIPFQMPFDEKIDFGFLGQLFNVAGGNIKNIVLQAAFLAASENALLRMEHLLRAGVNELKKNDIIVVKEDLREYADLIL